MNSALGGLACGAEAGVRYVLEMLRQEFDLATALIGPAAASEPETQNAVWMLDQYPDICYWPEHSAWESHLDYRT